MNIIQFDNFSCYYKNKKDYITALDSISLDIADGEFFVVLGQSGSGKTTLLKSILGLCDYIKGELHIDGVPIDQFRLAKSNIGYVRQQTDLYPHMTIYENIAFPLRTIHTPQEEVDRRVREAAGLLEIIPLLTRKPRQLSGGQQQRAAIAKALVKNPVIMLFDEPFSDLDPALRTELRLLLKKVHQSYHCTTVFVTHDLSDAYSLADRILLLENGKILALGTPRELIEKGYL